MICRQQIHFTLLRQIFSQSKLRVLADNKIPCFGAYNTHIFSPLNNFKLGPSVIHYNKQNRVFFHLKIGRIDIKKVTCSGWVGCLVSYKTAKVLLLQQGFSQTVPFAGPRDSTFMIMGVLA